MFWLAGITGVACALLILALATPARWWQRPTALAASLLLASSLLCAAGIYQLLHMLSPQPKPQIAQELAARVAPTSSAGETMFRVKHRLNLRQSASTSAAHLAQLETQQIVYASGQRIGDWWLVRACHAGQMQEGWVNSLWLRRLQELPAQGKPKSPCGA